MNDTIYHVKILSDSMSISDWFSILSVVISIFSAGFIFYKEFRLSRDKKLNLTISIKDRHPYVAKERFFIFFTFSNNSSKSINIEEIYLTDEDATTHITNTKKCIEGGSCIYNSVAVVSDTNPELKDKSLSLPLTLPPYSSTGGYIAFNAGKKDARILSNRTSLYVHLFLLNSTFEINMLTGVNMNIYFYHLTPNKIETICRERQYR